MYVLYIRMYIYMHARFVCMHIDYVSIPGNTAHCILHCGSSAHLPLHHLMASGGLLSMCTNM